jgi:hypothetical protein
MAKQISGKTGTRPTKKPQPKPTAPSKLCETCLYIDTQGSDRFRTHYCHRYPTTEIVAPSYWCGEWRPKDD